MIFVDSFTYFLIAKMKRGLIKYSLLLLSLTSALHFVNGQKIFDTKSIELEDGLREREVHKIIRDQFGFFYIFMSNHIQRYNGKSFEDLNAKVFNDANLEINQIQSLDLINDGTIIITIKDPGRVYYIKPKSLKVEVIEEANSVSNLVANKQHLFVKKKNEKYEISAGLNSPKDKLYDFPLLAFIPQKIFTNEGFLYLQNNEEVHYYSKISGLKTFGIKGKLIGVNGRFYVFNDEKIFKIVEDEIKIVATLPENNFKLGLLKADKIGNIFAAYSSRTRFYNRAFVLDENEKLHNFQKIIDVNSTFIDAYTDDVFHKWMIGGHNGIFIINFLRDGVDIIHKNFKKAKNSFGNVISSFAKSSDGNLIFAQEAKGLYTLNTSTNAVNPILTSYLLEDKFQRNMMMYHQEGTNKYFIYNYKYTNESDLFRFDSKTEIVESFAIDFKMNDFYILNDNALLLGGYDNDKDFGVLKEFDLKKKVSKVVFQGIKEIRTISYFPKLEEFWIGTIEGIYVLDKNYKQKYTFNRYQTQKKRLISEDHIRNIALYNDKIIAGSLGGGIFIINPANYELENQISDFNGLTNNKAVGIIEDDLGNCWISTYNGLNVMDNSFKIIQTIEAHEGLPNREFNTKSVIKDNTGMLYFGSTNGIAKVDPVKMLKWKKTSGISINEVHSFTNDGQSQLLTEKFETYDSADSVVINYSTPDYFIYPFNSSNTYFRDSTNALHFKNYENRSVLSNFKSGKFKVYAVLDNDSTRESFELQVDKDNRTLWKIIGLIIGVLSLAFLIAKVVISRNKKAELKKTAMNKRIAEFQLSALRSQMNPHFIFNALGAIQYFIQTQNAEKADEYLSDFALLMRKILESSKSKFISVSEELKILKLYIGLEKVRFDHIFDYEFEVDAKINQESRIPPMIIQPFVENAINHGLFNLKDRKGLLKIEFIAKGENDILCIIRDNGVGRKKAAELRMKSHKSRGMQIVGERVETIKKAGEMQIEITTKDLYDKSMATGTEIRIELSPI